jgi:hypothetical protein
MKRREIELAITNLPPNELASFRKWFEGYYPKALSKQLEQKQHIDKLKGSLKGKGLMKALKADKDLEKKI